MNPLTRDEYERARKELAPDATPRTDSNLALIAKQEGPRLASGRYDGRPLIERMLLALDVQRGHSAIAKGISPTAPKPRTVPQMGGQLWDECERCGREPIYQPLFLCQRCWPRRA